MDELRKKQMSETIEQFVSRHMRELNNKLLANIPKGEDFLPVIDNAQSKDEGANIEKEDEEDDGNDLGIEYKH